MILQGEIVRECEGGFVAFISVSENEKELIKERCKEEIVVEIDDGRGITAAQRRKAYVLIRAIAEWWSDTPQEVVKEITKMIFLENTVTLKNNIFSLSDCDRTTARLYITFLIELCLLHDIPCGEPFWKLCEDLERYTYACLMRKKCVVCGKKSDLHHVDAVGMGNDRKEICHVGLRALPLCRKHHTEAHSMGREQFLKKYAVAPIKITEDIADAYALRKKSRKPKQLEYVSLAGG